MGYVSYQEDILDASGKPNDSKYFPEPLGNPSRPKTSPVPKTRYVTSSEIQRHIQVKFSVDKKKRVCIGTNLTQRRGYPVHHFALLHFFKRNTKCQRMIIE